MNPGYPGHAYQTATVRGPCISCLIAQVAIFFTPREWGVELLQGCQNKRKRDSIEVSSNFLMVWASGPTFVMLYM